MNKLTRIVQSLFERRVKKKVVVSTGSIQMADEQTSPVSIFYFPNDQTIVSHIQSQAGIKHKFTIETGFVNFACATDVKRWRRFHQLKLWFDILRWCEHAFGEGKIKRCQLGDDFELTVIFNTMNNSVVKGMIIFPFDVKVGFYVLPK